MKHELRTCLNQILGFGELLLESADDDGKIILAAHTKTILAHAESMRVLIATLTQEAHFEDNATRMGHFQEQLRHLVSQIRTELAQSSAQSEAAYQHDLEQVKIANLRLLALLDSSFSPNLSVEG